MDPKPLVTATQILRITQDLPLADQDLLVTEEPLEIRLGYGPAHDRKQQRIAVTMRTPGHDLELTLGFLLTEGIIQQPNQLAFLEHCTQVNSPEELGNIVKAELRADLPFDPAQFQRNFYASSSCGVCGKASIETLHAQGCAPIPPSYYQWPASSIHTLSDQTRQQQTVFKHTGGIHAATLFSPDGRPIITREDIGRHNALDKVIGAHLASSNPDLQDHLLFLSGRAGFELLQKAAMAGIPLVAAVGAPSSLAVQLATQYQITLLGFVRDHRFNIYTHPERINPHA